MSTFSKSILLPLGLLLTFTLYSSIYVVQEGEIGIRLRFGKLITNADQSTDLSEPGLHFKMPWADTVVRYDARLQLFAPENPERILTREKKDVLVSFYVQWKIKNFSVYHTNTASGKRVDNLLGPTVAASLRDQFGSSNIRDLVTDRLGGTENLKKKLKSILLANLGVELIDLRINQIDLPMEVSDSVFTRMRAERQKSAAERRGMGTSKAEATRAEADRDSRTKLALTNQKSMQIRSTADAEAAKIYADAYNASVDFYQFFRSLEAYKNAQGPDDVLVLNPEGEFFKYFKQLPK
ncbi:MAG: protease modulator HflC [Gammaproteobacteria bacterium]